MDKEFRITMEAPSHNVTIYSLAFQWTQIASGKMILNVRNVTCEASKSFCPFQVSKHNSFNFVKSSVLAIGSISTLRVLSKLSTT